MYQTDISQDITTSIQQALDTRLDLLDEASLVQHSDSLLTKLPSLTGSHRAATTAMFLRRYDTALHKELCRAGQPASMAATVPDAIRDLTRAVLVTVGVGEGVSVEAAVGIALVLYRRGIVPFCAQPMPGMITA
jgi:hypothetical protein